MEIKIGGIYKHYKGEVFKVLFIAKAFETNEEMVVYETVGTDRDKKHWVRPVSGFFDPINYEGKATERFVLFTAF